MKSLLILTAYSALRTYIGTGLFDRIKEFVLMVDMVNITGDEKRDRVRAAIRNEVETVSIIVIDTAIQIVLMRFLR